MGWLGTTRSMETAANWSLPAILKLGSWSQCLIIVTEWECGLHATRVSHFPKGARRLAFLRCEISPFLNVGPNSLKTHLRAKANISEGQIQLMAACLKLQLTGQR